jgi:hypothetical protein
MTTTTPQLRESLQTPRFYSTKIAKPARSDISGQRLAFDALPRVFIGHDRREGVAVNVLADSIQAQASRPVLIGQVRLSQLQGIYRRPQHPLQSTDFSFSRFLVPWLTGFEGWSLFIDADMLCLGDIAELWDLRDERYAVQVVQHEHHCEIGRKFQEMPQTPYRRKNWSSLMLFNGPRCRALTPEWVNQASGLELHQFQWLSDGEIGALPPEWNVLVGVQPVPAQARILHYTLGGPWFDDCRDMALGDQWLAAQEAMNDAPSTAQIPNRTSLYNATVF